MWNKGLHITAVLFLFLLSGGCSENNAASYAEKAGVEAGRPERVQSESREIEVERKLIKEGFVEFETADMGATRKKIFDSLEKYKAYIASDREYRSGDRISNTIVVRVPAANFDSMLHEVTRGVKHFDSKNVEVKDVTEEFLDVEARLKTKKELENRYLELLKKANTVSEILEVEKQTGQLRSEIESIEGRLKYLKNQVAFSTLHLTFYQSIPEKTEFGSQLIKAFQSGWDNLIGFLILLVRIWPFIIIGFALFFGIKMWKKRK